MSCTNSAVAFASPMDPSDVLDYVADFSTLFEVGEVISSFDVSLSQDAIGAGVVLQSTPPPVIEASGQSILFWMGVSLVDQESEVFCGVGFKAELTFTLETSITPRVYQRTFTIDVRQL